MQSQSLLYNKGTQLHTYRHSFLNIIFHNCLSQGIEYSSLCYTLGSCFFVCFVFCTKRYVEFPQPGIKLLPLQWKQGVSTLEIPGKSQDLVVYLF